MFVTEGRLTSILDRLLWTWEGGIKTLDLIVEYVFQLECQAAQLQARIRPTALCSVIDKENLIEFLLDFIHYIYTFANPNPDYNPMLPYESLSSCVSID